MKNKFRDFFRHEIIAQGRLHWRFENMMRRIPQAMLLLRIVFTPHTEWLGLYTEVSGYCTTEVVDWNTIFIKADFEELDWKCRE